jgi:AraC-like DNA-binding protein
MLVYIYSGVFSIHDGITERTFRAGSSVFVRKNHRIKFLIGTGESEQIRIVFLIFNRNFLLDMYHQIEKSYLADADSDFKYSFLTVPVKLDIESLVYSLVPYFNAAVQPSEKMMKQKLSEGLYALLNADKRASITLFDFIDPWKIDILNFLNENFMYDLSLEEVALYTGRSLASFKRDFKKVSDLPPMKWITNKRLETAHQQMKDEDKKVSDIYLEVGFKSLSHFSTAYKKRYGIAPTTVQ